MLFNRDGLVFVARRADLPNAEGAPGGWQLPQGGIDAGEDPRAAVLRELAEEIGTDRAEIIGEHPDWLTYDLPPHLVGVALRGRYRGQRQRWFALRFIGEDADIRLDARSASGVRRLALGGAGRAAGAGGGLQAADLRDSGPVVRPLRHARREPANRRDQRGGTGSMLRLRAEQMIALSGPALTRRIVVALSDRYPLETMALSRTALTALVRGAIGRAAAAGMRTEHQVSALCGAGVAGAAGFRDQRRDRLGAAGPGRPGACLRNASSAGCTRWRGVRVTRSGRRGRDNLSRFAGEVEMRSIEGEVDRVASLQLLRACRRSADQQRCLPASGRPTSGRQLPTSCVPPGHPHPRALRVLNLSRAKRGRRRSRAASAPRAAPSPHSASAASPAAVRVAGGGASNRSCAAMTSATQA